jgi:hypothetical protein
VTPDKKGRSRKEKLAAGILNSFIWIEVELGRKFMNSILEINH